MAGVLVPTNAVVSVPVIGVAGLAMTTVGDSLIGWTTGVWAMLVVGSLSGSILVSGSAGSHAAGTGSVIATSSTIVADTDPFLS
jgi:hypothetical protein